MGLTLGAHVNGKANKGNGTAGSSAGLTHETSYDTIFGRMAVEYGLCTKEEVQRSIEELKNRSRSGPVSLKELMVELGYLTKGQAQRLQAAIKDTKTLAVPYQIPGYKIIGKLGAGAMAVVFKAVQLSLNRTVAIKVLPKRFSSDPEYVRRFYKEGQAAGKLHHNNIVQAIDVGEAGGYHYFVMEYVEGKTIADDLAAGKVFSEQEALEIIIQVAQALDHAHTAGLVHRDVKPKNIMITKDGVVKLADMGLARETSDIETAKYEAGKAYGTPYYIAPEQIKGMVDIDGRADIYSLGATFYHMVTGRVPFTGEDSAEIMRKHLKEPLTPPDHINTALSAGVSEIIEVMMAKRREDRYANAKELLADLLAVKNGQPPLRAKTRFDVSAFEKLEEGTPAEDQDELAGLPEAIARYRTATIILGVACAILLLLVVFLLAH